MQIEKKYYDPAFHDRYKALSVKQPYASLLLATDYIDEKGTIHARKTIEVRSRNTNYRGDLLICSTAKPSSIAYPVSATIGLVELYDVKPVKDFTPEEWEATCIPPAQRPLKGYGWLVRNPRRVVEIPIKGQLGLWDFIITKNELTEYPRALQIGSDGWELIQKKLHDGTK